MDDIKKELVKRGFKGELDDSAAAKETYSHDASMFELRPELVVMPMDAEDVTIAVKLVAEKKKSMPKLSLTGRSAGTDMAGGAINESIIMSFTQHMNQVSHVSSTEATTQPGVYYRDFESETLKHGALMPSYPASRDMAAVGGIANNNAGGEKSLEYGKTADWVKELKLVFADGVAKGYKAPD